ncbi:serine hydrolase domain-containing protein [Tateyamaria pelophila]|uniref:serine hydrolase domain-containing protein n=1 Tax=Tateyamaria pelophila TaxID=328415 RepID=UPI001CBEC791|nr:serine hydrolase domain-containing protein [Tateyamaria pelophila]
MTLTLDPNRLARITPWAARYVAERKFPGLSVLIRQSGREVFFDAVGQRDLANGTAFSRDTVARIYSMTKPVTSLALMMLMEEGRFTLDTPVSRFLPDFSDCHALIPGATSLDQVEPSAPPTLHQLLTHVSGLSYPFNTSLVSRAMAERDILFKPNAGTLESQCKATAALPLAFQPGTRWEYSVGIDVIGRVIEVITGQTLGAVFKERIFEPLGMTETAFSVPAARQDRFANLYTPLAGNPMDLGQAATETPTLREVDNAEGSPFLNPTLHSGGGGLLGTIDDYMRFSECLRLGGQGPDGPLISSSTAAFMMANHLPGDIASLGPSSFAEQPMDGVGFSLAGAVVLDPARSRVPSSVGDFSWGGMASTFFWIDPVHDLSVVMFTQLTPSSSYPARAELKALVHGALT